MRHSRILNSMCIMSLGQLISTCTGAPRDIKEAKQTKVHASSRPPAGFIFYLPLVFTAGLLLPHNLQTRCIRRQLVMKLMICIIAITVHITATLCKLQCLQTTSAVDTVVRREVWRCNATLLHAPSRAYGGVTRSPTRISTIPVRKTASSQLIPKLIHQQNLHNVISTVRTQQAALCAASAKRPYVTRALSMFLSLTLRPVFSRLSTFLPQLSAANATLEADMAADAEKAAQAHSIEHVDPDERYIEMVCFNPNRYAHCR